MLDVLAAAPTDLVPAAIGDRAAASGVALLVLFGSRARGDASRESDWDFGYVASSATPDAAGLLADLVTILGTERVDLVDLRRASVLLAYRAAKDGVPVYEQSAGAFLDYQFQASRTWCEMEPVLRRAWADLLAEVAS